MGRRRVSRKIRNANPKREGKSFLLLIHKKASRSAALRTDAVAADFGAKHEDGQVGEHSVAQRRRKLECRRVSEHVALRRGHAHEHATRVSQGREVGAQEGTKPSTTRSELRLIKMTPGTHAIRDRWVVQS
eukprot:6172943-Pleurochrysis_carterae.AAC.3